MSIFRTALQMPPHRAFPLRKHSGVILCLLGLDRRRLFNASVTVDELGLRADAVKLGVESQTSLSRFLIQHSSFITYG